MLGEMITQPMLLPVTIALLAGLVCLLVPHSARRLRGLLAVGSSAVVLGLAWRLFMSVGGEGAIAFDPVPWLSLRLDALGAFILLAIAFFALLITIFSLGYMKESRFPAPGYTGRRLRSTAENKRTTPLVPLAALDLPSRGRRVAYGSARRERQREYYAYLLWTLGISCAVVLANELLLLLVCWGFLGLMLYLMAGIAGPRAAEAARKSLMIIGGSDALLLLGIVLYWNLAGTTQLDGAALALDSPLATIAFLTFVAGAFAKAGAVPFHTWVPDFGEKTDAPVSAYLPASLDKLLGIYLLARCVLDLFVLTPAMYLMLMLLGAVTVISAVMMALVQHDLKRLLSYHAVSQVGYMVLGIGTGTAIGLAGGLFH
ncbi:MAG: proton-conducting transporter membrane subunit, partial [Thiogranum sp.]